VEGGGESEQVQAGCQHVGTKRLQANCPLQAKSRLQAGAHIGSARPLI
jgi:hypothetical protein